MSVEEVDVTLSIHCFEGNVGAHLLLGSFAVSPRARTRFRRIRRSEFED